MKRAAALLHHFLKAMVTLHGATDTIVQEATSQDAAVTRRVDPRDARIGVLLGGRSAERDVSLQSGAAMANALAARGYNVVTVDVGDRPADAITRAGVELAVIALHGRYGEDGCMQGMLEMMGIPYTGAGVLSSALAMDKVVSKRLMSAAGVPTPKWIYPATVERVEKEIGFPAVIKPRGQGSSVGVSICQDAAQLKDALALATSLGGSALAEVFVPGCEIAVGVIGMARSARVLGTIEIRPATDTYDYQAKYERDDTQYLVPAPVPPEVDKALREAALAAHRCLECSGATRVDIRWNPKDDAPPQVLEVNTLPGMTDHSLLPKLATGAGLSYEDLVVKIVDDAGLNA